MKVFTIGYGGLEPWGMVAALKKHSVRSVVDIPIWPIRASMGSYVLFKSPEKGSQGFFVAGGYCSLFVSGARESFQRTVGLEGAVPETDQRGGRTLTERLKEVPDPLCLLCAEKDPNECHRLILAELLEQGGHEVQHIVVDQGLGRQPAASVENRG